MRLQTLALAVQTRTAAAIGAVTQLALQGQASSDPGRARDILVALIRMQEDAAIQKVPNLALVPGMRALPPDSSSPAVQT